MNQETQSPAPYDFRQYDQVWRRVGPGLEPYPDMAAEVPPVRQIIPARQMAAMPQAAAGASTAGTGENAAVSESQLPGAEPNPCCMGTEAAELLTVLEGYIEEELEARRWYLALARQAPAWGRQTLRELAEDEGNHAQRLLTVHYLITDRRYRPLLVCGPVDTGGWVEDLRRSYHNEVCTAMNYARSADSTPDVCLSRLLTDLSAAEYRHADQLMALLDRALRQPGRC